MTSKASWTLYASNEEAWDSMLADCAKAKKTIVIEQYIFYTDERGKKLIDICAERAAAGPPIAVECPERPATGLASHARPSDSCRDGAWRFRSRAAWQSRFRLRPA